MIARGEDGDIDLMEDYVGCMVLSEKPEPEMITDLRVPVAGHVRFKASTRESNGVNHPAHQAELSLQICCLPSANRVPGSDRTVCLLERRRGCGCFK